MGWEMTPEEEAKRRMKEKLREEMLTRQLLTEHEFLPLSSLNYTYSIDPSKIPPLPPPSVTAFPPPTTSQKILQAKRDTAMLEEKILSLELKLREQQKQLEEGKQKILNENLSIEKLRGK